MKKLSAIILSIALVLSLAVLPGTVVASALSADGYYYTVSNGKATITGCVSEPIGKLTIPSTLGGYPVTSIGNWAFDCCTGLTSVTIPDSVTSIGEGAFYDCGGLTSVTIGNSVTSIGTEAFDCCTGLESIIVNDGNKTYRSENNCLIEKATNKLILGCKNSIIPSSVTSIGNQAFSGCTGLTEVIIPNSVTSIGKRAFISCTGLTSVTIPSSVTSIGDNAFFNCGGLTSVTIPNSVTSIGNGAFSDCTGLTSIIVDSGNSVYRSENNCIIEKATNELILGCKNSIIPSSVTSIGYCAFAHCTGLTSVTIPDSVTSIGDSAFASCSGLTSFTIGNGLTSIDIEAFSDCTGLKKVDISDLAAWCNIKFNLSHESNPLYYAHNLYLNGELVTNLVIPDGVTSIGDYAFVGCTGLTSVTIPSSVTSIGEFAFDDCTGLTEVTIPNSVTSIGEGAFSGCSGLTSVTIGNGVTSIGNYAFYRCTGLTEITIPNSVTSIGYMAFYRCYSIQKVIYCGTEEERKKINIDNKDHYNDSLLNSNWQYHDYDNDDDAICNICGYNRIWNAFVSDFNEGWNNIDGKVCYVKNGELLTGLQNIGKKLYFFDENGVQCYGFKEIDGKYYYFQNVKYGGAAYYGKVAHGGKIYNTSVNGYALYPEGWNDGMTYYVENGVKVTGIKTIDNKTYFFKENGEMSSGLKLVDGKYYYFNSLKYGGTLYKGVISSKGKTYDTSVLGYAEGAEGWTADKTSYIENGVKVTGLKKIGKLTYYFDENGEMSTGFKMIDGTAYFFVAKSYGGYAYTGKVSYGGKVYTVKGL